MADSDEVLDFNDAIQVIETSKINYLSFSIHSKPV